MQELGSKPLADARSHFPKPNGISALLVNELFAQPEIAPEIKALLTEVLDLLKQQEGEIHQLGCVIKQQERRIQHQDEEIEALKQETARQKEEIVNEAQAPLLEENAALEKRVAALEETNRQLQESVHEASQGEATARFCAGQLHTRIMELEVGYAQTNSDAAHNAHRITDLEATLERTNMDAAHNARRITALETPTPQLSQKTATDHIDRLFSEMRRLRLAQVTTKDAARILGLSKNQAKKIKPYLAEDHRFAILRDPRHKQRHLIRLT